LVTKVAPVGAAEFALNSSDLLLCALPVGSAGASVR
jgi:hypothetical protein